MSIFKPMSELEDELCEYCPLPEEERGCPAPPLTSCEGSHCEEAYERYKECHREE